jgi:hypothetical protein
MSNPQPTPEKLPSGERLADEEVLEVLRISYEFDQGAAAREFHQIVEADQKYARQITTEAFRRSRPAPTKQDNEITRLAALARQVGFIEGAVFATQALVRTNRLTENFVNLQVADDLSVLKDEEQD